MSFVEFHNKNTVKNFVKAVADSGLDMESASNKLSVKPATTQKNNARNWVLRKAEEVLKVTSDTLGMKVDWKERAVGANGEEAFKQERDDLGTFKGNFSHLVLPCEASEAALGNLNDHPAKPQGGITTQHSLFLVASS